MRNAIASILSRKLAGKTIFITGASRGIGKAIALKAARDGANIVVAAKTAEPHPKLPGTIYTAAKESKSWEWEIKLYAVFSSLIDLIDMSYSMFSRQPVSFVCT